MKQFKNQDIKFSELKNALAEDIGNYFKDFREKRKEEGFKILEEAQNFLSLGEFDMAIESYRKVSEIFAQIQWVEELPLIKQAISDIEIKKKEKEIELRLHESLLPVKNEKDRKVVKEYFSKIFNIISKDLRKQISELDIPKKQRKDILKELAFLAEEEQLKYIGALKNLYETIPEKLIERIRKLHNVKPQYYDKIVEELKYLDSEEQIEFVVFLEKNA